jgi:hypothetical protein
MIQLIGIGRYVDVSTVDGATAKLISGHVTATGASYLEVKLFFGLISKSFHCI